MMEIMILVLMMFVLFKVTGFLFKIVGKMLGIVFGITGYVLLGVLSVAAFGMALAFLPLIVLIGIAGIAALAGRVV
jgi:hypothetical protein